MKEETENPLYVSYNIVKNIFNKRMYHIPKPYHHIILKEMEEIGLIKKVENKPNLRYELVGKDVHKLLFKYEDVLF